jgi:ABC-type sugar transport system ATPase subunit
MSDQSIAVEARDVSKRYRNVWALRECSFQLPAGRIIALVGANGAGKSTLMSIISGMLAATSGWLLVNGRPVEKGGGATADASSRVAILAQDKPLYRDFSVADMLRFGRCTNRLWDQRRAVLVGALRRAAGPPLRQALRRPAGAGRSRGRPGFPTRRAAAGRTVGQPRPGGPHRSDG